MKVIENIQNGNVSIVYCKTHHNHKIELGHLRLPESTRLEIAAKLHNGVSIERILDDIRDSGKTNQSRTFPKFNCRRRNSTGQPDCLPRPQRQLHLRCRGLQSAALEDQRERLIREQYRGKWTFFPSGSTSQRWEIASANRKCLRRVQQHRLLLLLCWWSIHSRDLF